MTNHTMKERFQQAKAEWEKARAKYQNQLTLLKNRGNLTPINAISLRRDIADSLIPVARYHMTRI
jgi:hypothetical protein